MLVLIAGGGIIGLTLAQGCKKRGIPFLIFEKAVSRPQGWGLTLSWGLHSLQEIVSHDVMSKLTTAVVREDMPETDGTVPILNASTGTVAFRVPLHKGRCLRVNRKKLRGVLAEGIDVQWGKELVSYTSTHDGVIATFADGTSVAGEVLIGADGAHSKVRRLLLGEHGELNPLPYRVAGVISRSSYTHVEPLFDISPWFFVACDPHSPTAAVFGLQEIFKPKVIGEETEVEFLYTCAWRATGDENDVKHTDEDNVREMKRRATTFAEPVRSALLTLPDSSMVHRLKLADWVPVPYESPNSRVMLAGDAAHTMTMFRGEGVNYGFLTSLVLLKHLASVQAGEETLDDAVKKYEEFARVKGTEGVLLSRAAAESAMDFGNIKADSPFVSRSDR